MASSNECTSSPFRNTAEIKACIVFARLELYNQGGRCGPDAVRRRLTELQVQPMPSRSAIAKILAEECLIHGPTGHYPG